MASQIPGISNVDDETSFRAFGIGCFNFRYEKQFPYVLTAAEYIADLSDALKRLTSLSKLEITYEESLAYPVNIGEKVSTIKDGVVFPALPFGQISFQLYIPKRVQTELTDGLAITETENFRISIRHCFYGPVTFVECLSPGNDCDPSAAVQVVREYLEREFEKIPGPVYFEALGPSPFHIDFFARPSSQGTGEFAVTETFSRGYDRFDIIHNERAEDPLQEIYSDFEDELDVYYQIIRNGIIQRREWELLQEKWNALRVRIERPKSFFNIAEKFSVHNAARELISDAFTFSASDQISKQEAERMVEETYGKGLRAYFKPRVEFRAVSTPNYPTQAVLDWAKHIHESSFKVAEIASVLFSALLGGMVGALITAMLGVGAG